MKTIGLTFPKKAEKEKISKPKNEDKKAEKENK